MTLDDFSHGFDTLIQAYSKTADFGEDMSKADIRLDEWEKSVYLTRYQEELVISLYNGKNASRESFEETEELRRYLSNIVKEAVLEPITNTNGIVLGMESNSKFFSLPEDLWFITYESVKTSDSKCGNVGVTLEVYPTKQEEYHRIRKNPFRGANNRRALRLDLSDDVVEIICKYTVSQYYLRYLRKISPIILIDLEDGLTVNGENEATPCELHEALHQRILEGAVAMALQDKGLSQRANN